MPNCCCSGDGSASLDLDAVDLALLIGARLPVGILEHEIEIALRSNPVLVLTVNTYCVLLALSVMAWSYRYSP